MKRHKVLRMLRFLPLVVLFLVVFGYVVMGLWNWLTPALFGWKPIGYWQAWGLLILTRILFGGLHGPGEGRQDWRHRMMERCEQMTPEEREKFRQAFQERWGRTSPPDSTPSATA